MALTTDAMMVLFYDVDGDAVDHDDWHSTEHLHERLSIPGFRRATRWVSKDQGPRYLVTYEVDNVDIATSPAYLARLNAPSDWTRAIMPRFHGMTRGFCRVVATTGYGLGQASLACRFTPSDEARERMTDWLTGAVLSTVPARQGLMSAHLLKPEAPTPMTVEQSMRGRDTAMPWLVLVTGLDQAALKRTVGGLLTPEALREHGAQGEIALGHYALHCTATDVEVARTKFGAPPSPRAN